MAVLGLRVRHYKVYAAWLAEKAGRVAPNGHLLGRSPLSDLLELEIIRLGIEGKASAWCTLRTVAEEDERIKIDWLDGPMRMGLRFQRGCACRHLRPCR